MQYRKDELIKINLAGKENTVTCRHCGATETFKQVDQFVTLTRPSLKTDGRTEIRLRTNKQFLAYFRDSHWASHQPKKKTANGAGAGAAA